MSRKMLATVLLVFVHITLFHTTISEVYVRRKALVKEGR